MINELFRLPNGHINFEKFWQLAKQVTEFMTWKQVTCPFEKHPKVIHYLQTGTILSENGMVVSNLLIWLLSKDYRVISTNIRYYIIKGIALSSFDCEPPENSHEKERFKALK